MHQLQFTQGDERWTALRERGLRDLYFFNQVILGYGDKVPMRPKTHYLMCRFLERRTGVPEIDTAPFQIVLVPRETGKTTLGTQGRPLQRLCRNPDMSTLICNEKLDNATNFLGAIKWHFEYNDLFRSLYPEVIPPDFRKTTWATDRIIIPRNTGRKEPSMFCIGVGGTVTGMHPDEIVVDDAISREAAENARVGSRNIMESVNRWTHTLDPLLNSNFADPFPSILWIGTHWWYDDCHDHVQEAWGYGEEERKFLVTAKFDDGSRHEMVMSRIGDVALFKRAAIENGQSIFPEKWSLEQLAKKRIRDPILFAANMMNEPSDEITADLKESWIVHYDNPDPETYSVVDEAGKLTYYHLNQLDVLMCVDPGGFGAKQTGGDRIRPAIMVTGTLPDVNRHLILYPWAEPVTYMECINRAVDLCRRFSPRVMGVERAGQQIAFIDHLRKALKDAGLVVAIVEIKPDVTARGGVGKDQHILKLEPYAQNGMLLWGKSAIFSALREEWRQFPRSGKKDLLDVLSMCRHLWRRVTAPPHAMATGQRRIKRELDAYYAKRGLRRGV